MRSREGSNQSTFVKQLKLTNSFRLINGRGNRCRAAWNTNREPRPESGSDFSSFKVKVINPVYDERAQADTHEERLQLIDSRETVGFDKLIKCLGNLYRAAWNTNREPGPEFGSGFCIFNVRVIEVVPFQLGSGQ